MIGTTRSNVNMPLRRLQRHGFIDKTNGTTVNAARLSAMLNDEDAGCR
jgi:hypothetical protein